MDMLYSALSLGTLAMVACLPAPARVGEPRLSPTCLHCLPAPAFCAVHACRQAPGCRLHTQVCTPPPPPLPAQRMHLLPMLVCRPPRPCLAALPTRLKLENQRCQLMQLNGKALVVATAAAAALAGPRAGRAGRRELWCVCHAAAAHLAFEQLLPIWHACMHARTMPAALKCQMHACGQASILGI